MTEEAYHSKRNHSSNNAKAVVYLGGKSVFRKFLLELKQTFRKYQLNQSFEEFSYEGERRGTFK